MSTIKDKFISAVKRVVYEFTRVDRTCNNCEKENFGGESVGEKLFCADCYAHLPFNSGNVCAHCGRSVVEPTAYCDDCSGMEWWFDAARSPFYYAPPINGLIRDFKYKNKRYLADVFAKLLSQTFYSHFSSAEVITFVPMTEKKRKERGYNQGYLLAKKLSKEVGVPCEELLEKIKDNDSQAKLGRRERYNNLKGTIKIKDGVDVRGKIVLLVDDVLTTGMTAQAASSELKKAGAEWVFVLTVASVTDRKVAKALGQETNSSLPLEGKNRGKRDKNKAESK